MSLEVAWHVELGGDATVSDVKDNDAVDASGEDVLGVLGHINGVAGAQDIKLTRSDALVGVVNGDFTIVTAGEEQITVLVVHDFANGTRVAWHVVRLHGRVLFCGHFL